MTLNRPYSLIAKFGNFLILAGLFLIGYQAFRWMQGGYWHFIPISRGFYYLNIEIPNFELPFLKRIIDWTLDVPMALALVVAGLVLRVAEPDDGGEA